MSLDSAWRRFDASRWMHRLLVLQTIVLASATAAVAFLGLFSGRFGAAVLAALLPAALTALSGWFAAAWSRGQAWTWWAVLVLQVVGLAAAVMASGAGDVVRVLGAVVGLLLVLHPDSRARIERRPQPSRPPSWRLPR